MSHFIEKCFYCIVTVSQCRCASTRKEVRWGVCVECQEIRTRKEVLVEIVDCPGEEPILVKDVQSASEALHRILRAEMAMRKLLLKEPRRSQAVDKILIALDALQIMDKAAGASHAK